MQFKNGEYLPWKQAKKKKCIIIFPLIVVLFFFQGFFISCGYKNGEIRCTETDSEISPENTRNMNESTVEADMILNSDTVGEDVETVNQEDTSERIYIGETPEQVYADIAEVYYQVAVEMIDNGANFESTEEIVGNAYICSNYRFSNEVEDIPVYLLHDLNGDGVKEFFVGIRTDYSNVGYVDYSICDVYTWKEGRAYQLMRGIGYRDGSCVICEDGVIKDEYIGSAFEGETLFHKLPIGSTELEVIDSTSFSITQHDECYYHNGEKISKEEYLELFEKYPEIIPEYKEITPEAIEMLRSKSTSGDNEVMGDNTVQDEKAEEDKIRIKTFKQEEIEIIPKVVVYSFTDAYEKGIVQEIEGGLPGLAEGVWYVIVVDGIEYIFCEYENEDPFLCSYSIISDNYSLANGISVGLTKEEIFSMYPEMVAMDFEGNYLQDEKIPNWGWNSASYPGGIIVADENPSNINQTFLWEEQFDYVILGAVDGEIDLGEIELFPVYIGLLMKDNVIKAITFYDPAAN